MARRIERIRPRLMLWMAVMSTEKKYLSLDELSAVSGLSASTLRRRVRDGTLPVIQPGGRRTRLLFRIDVLEKIGQSGQQPSDLSGSNDRLEAISDPMQEPVYPKLPGPRPRWQDKLPLRRHC